VQAGIDIPLGHRTHGIAQLAQVRQMVGQSWPSGLMPAMPVTTTRRAVGHQSGLR
jgi:hypothetical protein